MLPIIFTKRCWHKAALPSASLKLYWRSAGLELCPSAETPDQANQRSERIIVIIFCIDYYLLIIIIIDWWFLIGWQFALPVSWNTWSYQSVITDQLYANYLINWFIKKWRWGVDPHTRPNRNYHAILTKTPLGPDKNQFWSWQELSRTPDKNYITDLTGTTYNP